MAQRNLGLIFMVANQHGGIGAVMDPDDIAQEMFIAAVDAFERYFDPTRGTVSNFLGCVLWRFAAQLRRKHGRPLAVEIEPEYTPEPTGYFRTLLDDLLTRLTAYSQELGHILRVMWLTEGDVSAAARVLGMSRSTLYERIELIRRSPVGMEISAAF